MNRHQRRADQAAFKREVSDAGLLTFVRRPHAAGRSPVITRCSSVLARRHRNAHAAMFRLHGSRGG